jgi:hypothetical protein
LRTVIARWAEGEISSADVVLLKVGLRDNQGMFDQIVREMQPQ